MRRLGWWFLIWVLVAPALSAQSGYRKESHAELGIEYRVYEKLKSVPLKLGRTEANLLARFEPTDDSDYIYTRNGAAAWYLYLRSFDRVATAETGEGRTEVGGVKLPEGISDEQRQAILRAMAAREPKSYEDFVRSGGGGSGERGFLTEGKEYRAKGDKPAYELWEFYEVQDGLRGEIEWFTIAACYDMDGKDVVLECKLPADKRHKPDSKWLNYAKSMVTSLVVEEIEEDDRGDEERDRFADTDEKKASLERAKANIANLNNWSYFTLPDYIILYSWDPEKGRRGRRDATNFAEEIGRKVQEIRELFEEAYPPGDRTFPYSIIRVCSDYAEFSNYGGTSGGVVGWFSPGTKELVVFFDADRRFSNLDVIEVTYHEAWHQYSDSYFPDVELHRWFDEGPAEYFSQYEKRGRGWDHEILDGRFRSIRDQINVETYIPVGEIIHWSRAQFYGARAPDHYAQAYSMVDFVLRGKQKLGSRWDDRWDGIMQRYGDVCLQDKDPDKASRVAFEGVDVEAFTEAWITWVTKYMSK